MRPTTLNASRIKLSLERTTFHHPTSQKNSAFRTSGYIHTNSILELLWQEVKKKTERKKEKRKLPHHLQNIYIHLQLKQHFGSCWLEVSEQFLFRKVQCEGPTEQTQQNVAKVLLKKKNWISFFFF